MAANTRGRILTWLQEAKAALDAAEAEYEKEAAERDAAREERDARRAALDDYEKKRLDFRQKYGRLNHVEQKIGGQLATVENIGLLKTSVHDSVALGGKFIGSATGPAGSLVNTAVGQANTLLRGATTSDLVGLIPGSSTNAAGTGIKDVVGAAGTAAGVNNAISELRGFGANATLGAIGNAADAFEIGHDFGTFLSTGENVFRSAAPTIGDIFSLDNDQLRSLADVIEAEWDPGFLERLNGLDSEELANDLRELAEAREQAGEAGRQLRGATDAEQAAADAEDVYAKEAAEAEEAAEKRNEARQEYIDARVAAAKAGIMVDPQSL